MSHRASVMVMSLVLLGLAVGAWLVNRAPGTPTQILQFWVPSPGQLKILSDLEGQRMSRMPEESAANALAQMLMNHHLLLWKEAGNPDRRNALEADVLQQVRAFVERSGEEGYLAVGTFMARNLRQRLVALDEELQASQLEAARFLAMRGDSDGVRDLRALGGDFLEHAVGTGLLSGDAQTRAARGWVASTLFVQRWLIPLGGQVMAGRMSREEFLLVNAWKIEASQHLPLQQRLAMLETMPQLDAGYPAPFVAGVLLARAGKNEEAAAAFRQSADEGFQVEEAMRWLRLLRRL